MYVCSYGNCLSVCMIGEVFLNVYIIHTVETCKCVCVYYVCSVLIMFQVISKPSAAIPNNTHTTHVCQKVTSTQSSCACLAVGSGFNLHT